MQDLPVVEETNEQAANKQPDQGTFDVEWKPSTLVLDATQMATAELRATASGLQIAKPSAAMMALEPGNQLFVPGEGLFRVKSSTMQSAGMTLDVEQGSLLDAAEKGTITWRAALDLEHAVAIPVPNADPNWVVAKAGFPAFSYSGMLGRVAASLMLDNMGERTHMVAKLELPTKIKLTATADGTVTQGHVEGIYDFEGGRIKHFMHKLNGVAIEADFTLKGGGQAFDEKIELPWGLYIPITVGGLPAFIGLSVKAVLKATTGVEDEVNFKAKLKISGDTGVEIKTDLPNVSGNLHLNEFDTPDWDVTSTFTSGLSAAMEFPRYTFGMGKVTLLTTTPPDSAVGLYLATNFETITNAVVRKNAAGAQFCTFMNNNAEVKLGGSIKAFGLSFEKDTQLWFAKGPGAKSGPNCDTIPKP